MKRASLTSRLALLFAVAATVVLLVTGWVLSRAIDHHFLEQDITEIEGRIEMVRRLLTEIHMETDLDLLPVRLDDALAGHAGAAVAVIDDDGRIWFGSNTAVFPGEMLTRGGESDWPHGWAHGGRSFRGIARTLPTGMPDGEAVTVAVALDITHHDAFMTFFARVVWGFVLLAAAVMTALGWLAARQGLAPLRAVTGVAANVSAERLGERLPLNDIPAELRELAHVFNAMLDRLEDSFRRLSQFSTDIAHELRTPVNNLMMQAQVALSRARTPEEYRDLLGSSVEEYERLARMISDMLFLAKADNGLVVPRREVVDLAVEAGRLADFFEPLAAERNVHIAVEGAARTQGDRLMLDRAVSNLLSNAVRHAAPGSSVTVRLSSDAKGAIVTVENEGSEIAPEHLSRVFDRFYRADPSRHDSAESSGLGLAITQSIVHAHGGRIEAVSEGGRTRFTLLLPRE